MNRVWFLLVIVMLLVSACGGSTTDSSSSEGQDGGDPVAQGARLFDQATLGGQAGCKSCHSISSSPFGAGPSLGGIGLTAAERVPGQTAEDYLRQSIVEPNAYLVDDYTRGIMPTGYADNLTEAEIDSLVQYMLSLQ